MMNTPRNISLECLFAAVILFLPGVAFADYLKHDPPPDANKPLTGADLSCWLATAANMLAGAGYGSSATEQLRAEEIYEQLKPHLSGEG